MLQVTSALDSLTQVIALKDSFLAAALAHPETVTVAAVPDTIVRVASASLSWWAEGWRILAQLGTAALAVLGGYFVQKYRSDREERRAEEVALRTDEEILNQLAIGVSHIAEYLRPIRDQIVRKETVLPTAIQEATRRVRSFEALLPRLLQLRDREHATRLYMWYGMVESVPDDLELLAGNQVGRRELPQPTPLDPKLARVAELSQHPTRTLGEIALQRIQVVLAQSWELGASLDIYEAGDKVVPILTGRSRPRKPATSPPASAPEASSPPAPPSNLTGE